MSRHDRQRERQRVLVVATIVIAVFGVVYAWGSHFNNSLSSMDQISTQGGQD